MNAVKLELAIANWLQRNGENAYDRLHDGRIILGARRRDVDANNGQYFIDSWRELSRQLAL